MAPLIRILGYLTFFVDIAIASSLIVFVIGKLTGRNMRETALKKFYQVAEDYTVPLAFVLALAATSGSLYMSNILGWEPCRLCWFQRIFMYPLVLILGIAWVNMDKVRDYALALASTGFLVSTVHYAEQRITQFSAAGCSVFSISCSTKYSFQFGYITVPMMAWTAFLGIIVLMYRFEK